MEREIVYLLYLVPPNLVLFHSVIKSMEAVRKFKQTFETFLSETLKLELRCLFF